MVRSIMPVTPVGRVAVFVLLLYWFWQAVGLLWPTSYWYTVERVEVIQPAYAYQDVHLSVLREVIRPFDGEYNVIVEDLKTKEIVCDGSAALEYQPERNLPSPLTLSWWVGDECLLPEGDYHMITDWEVKGTTFDAFDKDVIWDTYFSVLESPYSPEIEQQINNQIINRLSEQVEQLTQELEELK